MINCQLHSRIKTTILEFPRQPWWWWIVEMLQIRINKSLNRQFNPGRISLLHIRRNRAVFLTWTKTKVLTSYQLKMQGDYQQVVMIVVKFQGYSLTKGELARGNPHQMSQAIRVLYMMKCLVMETQRHSMENCPPLTKHRSQWILQSYSGWVQSTIPVINQMTLLPKMKKRRNIMVKKKRKKMLQTP